MWISQKTGVNEEYIVLPNNATIEDLLYTIGKKQGLEKIVNDILNGKTEIIILHNSKTPANGLKTVLADEDEVVIMPTVSGG